MYREVCIGIKLQCDCNSQAGERGRNWQGDCGGETSRLAPSTAPMGR